MDDLYRALALSERTERLGPGSPALAVASGAAAASLLVAGRVRLLARRQPWG